MDCTSGAHAPFEIFVPQRHNKGINKKHQVVILGFRWRISDSPASQRSSECGMLCSKALPDIPMD